MKSQFKNTPIALALAALFVSPMAFADRDHDRNRDPVSIKKDISVEQDVEVEGRVHVGGYIGIDSSSMAVVDDKQVSTFNTNIDPDSESGKTDAEHINTATINANALQNAKGNIGLNVTAGDNNQQGNAAAFSAADASFVFGSSDAEIFATQVAFGNKIAYLGQTNAATLSGNALQNASGNIGVNISAGNSNQQKNDLAASVAVARMATATVQANQLNGGNITTNSPIIYDQIGSYNVDLAFNASGKTSGIVDQNGDQYLDTWSQLTHNAPGNVNTGHVDVDSAVQGASNRPVHAALDGSGNPTGPTSTGGSFSFNEEGDVALSGNVSGNIPVILAVNLATTNTSTLGDSALQNASGNIGVNISSGTNNQQFNGLAISATQAPIGGGSGTGPVVE